jgi:hypothetical protein
VVSADAVCAAHQAQIAARALYEMGSNWGLAMQAMRAIPFRPTIPQNCVESSGHALGCFKYSQPL